MTHALSHPRALDGLSEVASGYDAAIVDIWGVMHNGVAPYPGAVDACLRFQDERGPVVLVSNAPRPAHEVRRQLHRLGVPENAFRDVITSGDATRAELAARAPGPVYAIGPEKDASVYEGLGLQFADVEAAAFACVTGLFDDATETPADYGDILERCRARNLDMVSANPDIVVDKGGQLIYCGGAIAQAYAELGGPVIEAGKPHAPIYCLALQAVENAAGRPVDRARVIAVGDGPRTDLRGANGQNLDCVFVVGGIHAGDLGGGDVDLGAAAARIAAADGAHARYAMRQFAW